MQHFKLNDIIISTFIHLNLKGSHSCEFFIFLNLHVLVCICLFTWDIHLLHFIILIWRPRLDNNFRIWILLQDSLLDSLPKGNILIRIMSRWELSWRSIETVLNKFYHLPVLNWYHYLTLLDVFKFWELSKIACSLGLIFNIGLLKN